MAGPGLGVMERGAIAAKDGRIVYAGPAGGAPDAKERIDCDGRWITPGLIDCHTHLVHAGNRAHEFEMRLNGATYEKIARAGGGILSTVKETRAASEDELVAQSLPRLDALIGEARHGRDQVRLWADARRRNETASRRPRAGAAAARLHRCHLPRRACPAAPEAGGDKDRYIDLVCSTMLPAIAREKLAEAVDGFCETIAFSPAQIARVFETATKLGLRVKLHADQLTQGGGGTLAARFGAISADHLEHTSEACIAAMAEAGTAAVLLPGAYYFLRETKLPPIDLLRGAWRAHRARHRLQSRHLAADLAAAGAEHGRDPVPPHGGGMPAGGHAQCRQGTGTRRYRHAGGRQGLRPRHLEYRKPAELVYRIGFNPLHARIWNGQ